MSVIHPAQIRQVLTHPVREGVLQLYLSTEHNNLLHISSLCLHRRAADWRKEGFTGWNLLSDIRYLVSSGPLNVHMTVCVRVSVCVGKHWNL